MHLSDNNSRVSHENIEHLNAQIIYKFENEETFHLNKESPQNKVKKTPSSIKKTSRQEQVFSANKPEDDVTALVNRISQKYGLKDKNVLPKYNRPLDSHLRSPLIKAQNPKIDFSGSRMTMESKETAKKNYFESTQKSKDLDNTLKAAIVRQIKNFKTAPAEIPAPLYGTSFKRLNKFK